MILKEKFIGYKHALRLLELETLEERRKGLCLNFALKCLKNPKLKNMFPENNKKHHMETRNPDKYKVYPANTERLKKLAVIYMSKQLNEYENKQSKLQ